MNPAIKYIVFLAIVFGSLFAAYYKGKTDASKDYEIQLLENQKKIDDLIIKQAEVKDKVITEYVTKTKVIKEKGDNVVTKIKEYVITDCIIPNNAVSLYDDAVNNTDSATDVTDASPSEFTATEVITNAASNFSICHQNRQQLISLQQWITETHAVK